MARIFNRPQFFMQKPYISNEENRRNFKTRQDGRMMIIIIICWELSDIFISPSADFPTIIDWARPAKKMLPNIKINQLHSSSSSSSNCNFVVLQSWSSLSCQIMTPEPCGQLTNRSTFLQMQKALLSCAIKQTNLFGKTSQFFAFFCYS